MTTATLSHAVLLKACAEAGLAADGAEPLRIGENALWRLPHQVVARIARPGQWAAAVRELAVARWLHDCEVPAVRPLDALAEPVEVYGHPVTFWHELPRHRAGTAADIAPLLRRLHQLPVPDFQLGRLDPFVRLASRISEATTLDDEQRRWLWARLATLQTAWAASLRAVLRASSTATPGAATLPSPRALRTSWTLSAPPSGRPNGTSPLRPSVTAHSAPCRTTSTRRSAMPTART